MEPASTPDDRFASATGFILRGEKVLRRSACGRVQIEARDVEVWTGSRLTCIVRFHELRCLETGEPIISYTDVLDNYSAA